MLMSDRGYIPLSEFYCMTGPEKFRMCQLIFASEYVEIKLCAVDSLKGKLYSVF